MSRAAESRIDKQAMHMPTDVSRVVPTQTPAQPDTMTYDADGVAVAVDAAVGVHEHRHAGAHRLVQRPDATVTYNGGDVTDHFGNRQPTEYHDVRWHVIQLVRW